MSSSHDVIGIPGIPKLFHKALECRKVEIRMDDERYLRDHPELKCMIHLFMREVLSEHPANVIQFAGTFFDRDELRDTVEWYMQPSES